MFFKTLDKIRTKPKQVRNQYAFGVAFAFTAIVVGIWSLSLPSRFADIAGTVEGEEASTSPFSGLITQIKNQFGSAKESAASVFQSASSTSPTQPFLAPDLAPEKQNQQFIEIRISSSTASTSTTIVPKTIQIGTTTSTQATAQ